MATTISTSPLPALDSPCIQELRLSEKPDRYGAYKTILQAEWHAVQQQAKENIISARVTGYLLLEFHAQSGALTDRPCESLVSWVTSPPQGDDRNEHDVIFDVGELCRNKFIRSFRAFNVRYQPPSSHPSRPSFDSLEGLIKDSMEPTAKDYRTYRRKALVRDGFRCMVTGMFDTYSINHCAELAATATRDGVYDVVVQTCHIFNESTMQGIDTEGISENDATMNRTYFAAGALAILEMFGFSQFVEAFKESGGVHQVWNLLSLEPNLHRRFDCLELWFERTPQPGRYNVCVFKPLIEGYIRRIFVGPEPHVDGAPMVVDFTSQSEQAPAPDPLLLTLHAICARVAHMSGAAEFFDQLDWDAEVTKVLAFDGSSAPLLSNLISPFAVIPGLRATWTT